MSKMQYIYSMMKTLAEVRYKLQAKDCDFSMKAKRFFPPNI